ncbi:MAG: single-stranded DNA-binding protein [Cyclobacteriaceae bacterium]|nr:single-stranded DNA-binding protein [Cyclobacteriaceae bacterium]
MANDINNATLTGRLTRDPEVKYTGGGLCIVEFALANGYRKKSGDEWTDETNFFDCVYMGRGAEAVSKYLAKGKQIAVTAELRQERWEKDGQKRSKVKLQIRELQLLGGKSESSGVASFEDDPVPF